MRRILHSLLSVFTAVLLFFGTVPKDFIHGWTGHTDTIHEYHPHSNDAGTVFENEHHHCQFLKLIVTPFGAPVILQYHPVHYLVHTAYEATYTYLAEGAHPSQRCLRGPPAV